MYVLLGRDEMTLGYIDTIVFALISVFLNKAWPFFHIQGRFHGVNVLKHP